MFKWIKNIWPIKWIREHIEFKKKMKELKKLDPFNDKDE